LVGSETNPPGNLVLVGSESDPPGSLVFPILTGKARCLNPNESSPCALQTP